MNTNFTKSGNTPFYALIIRCIAAFFACLPTALFGHAAQTLTCPANVNVQAGSGECGLNVSFNNLVWSSTVPLVDTVFLPASGSFFETGITQVILGATDINGNNSVCIFYVNVLPFNDNALACPALLGVTLNGQCERQLTTGDLLPAGSFGCGGDYSILRLNPNGSTSPGIVTADDFAAPVSILVQNTLTNAQCTTQVVLTGGTPPSITCPPNVVIFCNEPLDSSNTGTPARTGCYQDLDLVWFDEEVGINCPDTFGFQITRFWVATDPFGKKDTCDQLITGMRFELEEVVFPPDFDGIEQPVIACSSNQSPETLTHPDHTGTPLTGDYPPDAHFHCKMAMTYEDFTTQECGVGREIKRVWKVVRLCLPTMTAIDTQIIVLTDVLPPVFEVQDTIFVSLSNTCADSLNMPPALNIEECSEYSVEIRTPWDTLYTNGGITHVNLVAGTYFIQYILTDACGNAATKISRMYIENKVLRSCPPDVTLTCDYYFDSLQVLLASGTLEEMPGIGNPIFYANCNIVTDETNVTLVSTCGIGIVERNIFTTNTNPLIICNQTITVEHVSDFEAQFPADTNLCVAPTVAVAGEPSLFNLSCEQISVTFTDSIANTIPGTCYTVYRKWQVSNTCYANPSLHLPDPETGTRRFQDGGDGFLQYTQVIEVNDNAIPVFPNGCEIADKIVGADCKVAFTMPTPVATGCGNVILTLSGSLGTTPGSTHELNPGSYNVTYKALGACGKMGTCVTAFSVLDTTPPVAVCKLPYLVIELMVVDPAMVQVWASDFNNGSTDNCGGVLKMSFSEDVLDLSRIYGCCEVGQNPIELWVTDLEGNQSHCETFVIVQSNMSNCDECEPQIFGNISTEDEEGVNQVGVEIFSTQGFLYTTFTYSEGNYEHITVPVGGDYQVTPSKDTIPLNGVTTFDAVLIRKHILSIQLLDSPYKIIAADINKSNSISTLDLVFLQKLILGIDTEFPNGNTSWRFIPEDYVFPDPTNPFLEDFPEEVFLEIYNQEDVEVNFIGIKVGDVNGNASVNLQARRREEKD